MSPKKEKKRVSKGAAVSESTRTVFFGCVVLHVSLRSRTKEAHTNFGADRWKSGLCIHSEKQKSLSLPHKNPNRAKAISQNSLTTTTSYSFKHF